MIAEVRDAVLVPLANRRAEVLGSTMAYVDTGGDGPVVLFLHGNPTSSYIWRNIIPHVSTVARCVAPDLIGYGASDKPEIDYSFADQVRYLDAFIEALGLREIFLVAQDWGTALAFHFAARFPERVRGLAFMEFIHPCPTWEDFHQSEQARELFKAIRTAGGGEKLVLEDNVFIERILPNAMMRKLADDEMHAYRAPFVERASRKPVLRMPRELPIAGEPKNVYATIEADHVALRSATYPKLLFSAEPGALISPAVAKAFVAETTNCRLVHLGAGRHYLQEDHPDMIGREIAGWMREIMAAIS